MSMKIYEQVGHVALGLPRLHNRWFGKGLACIMKCKARGLENPSKIKPVKLKDLRFQWFPQSRLS